MEPLQKEYISYSPYAYAICNPSKLFDVNGMTVYLSGPDADRVYLALSNFISGFKIAFKDGQLVIDGDPISDEDLKNLSEAEREIYKAITDEKYKVQLIATQGHSFPRINSAGVEESPYFIGGAWGDHTGNTAIQYINYEDLVQQECIGGTSVGFSIGHEMVEAYWGVKYDWNGNLAHKMITGLGGPFYESNQWTQKIKTDQEMIKRGYLTSPSGTVYEMWNINLQTFEESRIDHCSGIK